MELMIGASEHCLANTEVEMAILEATEQRVVVTIGARPHMTTSLVLSEFLMVLKQAYIEDLIICRKASPSAASRTNPLPPGFAQDRLEALMTTAPVPIEEGHVIILDIPVGISTCS